MESNNACDEFDKACFSSASGVKIIRVSAFLLFLFSIIELALCSAVYQAFTFQSNKVHVGSILMAIVMLCSSFIGAFPVNRGLVIATLVTASIGFLYGISSYITDSAFSLYLSNSDGICLNRHGNEFYGPSSSITDYQRYVSQTCRESASYTCSCTFKAYSSAPNCVYLTSDSLTCEDFFPKFLPLYKAAAAFEILAGVAGILHVVICSLSLYQDFFRMKSKSTTAADSEKFGVEYLSIQMDKGIQILHDEERFLEGGLKFGVDYLSLQAEHGIEYMHLGEKVVQVVAVIEHCKELKPSSSVSAISVHSPKYLALRVPRSGVQDRARQEAKNSLEKYVLHVRNFVKDEKLSDKINDAEKMKVNDALSKTTLWLETEASHRAEKWAFEGKQKALESIVLPILEKLSSEASTNKSSFLQLFDAMSTTFNGSGWSSSSNDAKKSLEKYVLQVRNTFDDEKLSDKIDKADKKKVKDAVSLTTAWLDANQSAEKWEFEKKQDDLEAIVLAIKLGDGAAPTSDPSFLQLFDTVTMTLNTSVWNSSSREAKKSLRKYVGQVHNFVNDEKLNGKISEVDKKTVDDAVSLTYTWLHINQSAEKWEFEKKQKSLESAVLPILHKFGFFDPLFDTPLLYVAKQNGVQLFDAVTMTLNSTVVGADKWGRAPLGTVVGDDRVKRPLGIALRVHDDISHHGHSPSRLYVSDEASNCVEVFNADTGEWIHRIGSGTGKGPGQMMRPESILLRVQVRSTQLWSYLYVADHNNNRVQVFDADTGTFLRSLGSGIVITPRGMAAREPSPRTKNRALMYILDASCIHVFDADTDEKYEEVIGSVESGSGPASMSNPTGLALLEAPPGARPDEPDLLFIADSGNNRIQVFDANFGGHMCSIGSKGSGPGQFENPVGVAVYRGENGIVVMYVSDKLDRVQVFTLDIVDSTDTGAWIHRIKSGACSIPRKLMPESLLLRVEVEEESAAVWSYLYVADHGDNKVQVFDADTGDFLWSLGANIVVAPRAMALREPSPGSDEYGWLYVLGATCVHVINADKDDEGGLLRVGKDSTKDKAKDKAAWDIGSGKSGSGTRDLSNPTGLALLSAPPHASHEDSKVKLEVPALLFIADNGNHRIQVFDADSGNHVSSISTKESSPLSNSNQQKKTNPGSNPSQPKESHPGSSTNQFGHPVGVAVHRDDHGNILMYVSDRLGKMQVYTLELAGARNLSLRVLKMEKAVAPPLRKKTLRTLKLKPPPPTKGAKKQQKV